MFFFMMRHISKIICLPSFQMVKVDRFTEREVERKKLTIFLSYLISSHFLWSLTKVRKTKLILMKSNDCFDQLVNKDYTTTCVTQLSNTFTVITSCNYSDS